MASFNRKPGQKFQVFLVITDQIRIPRIGHIEQGHCSFLRQQLSDRRRLHNETSLILFYERTFYKLVSTLLKAKATLVLYPYNLYWVIHISSFSSSTMAFATSKNEFFFALVLGFVSLQMAIASDADITSDFIIPPNITNVDGKFFTYTGMRVLVGANPPTTFKGLKASMAEFLALNGQSVSYAVLQYPAGSVNPPHTHPRLAELLFLLGGSLEVGFVDTTNKLFTRTLQAGTGVHYRYNGDAKNYAIAVSAFGSANAGTVSVPSSIFTTGIDDGILAKSFKTDVATIQAIKAGLAPKA
ncbi:hypothetical protein L1049_011297 [Liquidambar formosana]|uniref:Cupin type-1 domain-containing protein n=1 Tax=Liquidambar formosana TaxID=63359 RepID=A0AAP0RR91_LIQFO